MKLIVCVVWFVCFIASLRSNEVVENEINPTSESKPVKDGVPDDFLSRQIEVFQLFQYVYHPYSPMAYSVDYDLKQNLDSYEESVGQDFWDTYTEYTVPVNQIFSINTEDHVTIASALFKLFYYAKTWDIFIQTAKWARYTLNKDLFIFAFTAAIYHRSDCKSIIIPAHYEVNPYHYFTSDIIQAAENYKLRNTINDNSSVYFIVSEYTKYFKYFNGDDGKLAHFTNDVELNAYYYFIQLNYGSWLDSTFADVRRGEKYFYAHQQLIARYDLERLASGLNLVSPIDFDEQLSDGGFNSYLCYSNGLSFPSRENDWKSYDDIFKSMLTRNEERIFQAIDKGYFETDDREIVNITSPNDIEVLANLLQSTDKSNSLRYYGSFENIAKRYLSTTVFFDQSNIILPGALEQPETSLREPLFYRLYERVLTPYYFFQSNIPQYTTEDLDFPGVQILTADTSRLETYSVKRLVNLNNVISTRNNGDYDFIYIDNYQHDFDQFDINVTISSTKSQSAVLKIFIGPIYRYDGDKFTFGEMKNLYFELDNARIELVEGENIIQKSSDEFSQFIGERISFHVLNKMAEVSKKTFMMYRNNQWSGLRQGMPRRFILPKGRYEGFDLQFFFIVYPFESEVEGNFNNLPYGWPFDRPLFDGKALKNTMVLQTKVFLRPDII